MKLTRSGILRNTLKPTEKFNEALQVETKIAWPYLIQLLIGATATGLGHFGDWA
jgi:hypothetical protein